MRELCKTLEDEARPTWKCFERGANAEWTVACANCTNSSLGTTSESGPAGLCYRVAYRGASDPDSPAMEAAAADWRTARRWSSASGRECQCISYPNGGPGDASAEVLAAAAAAGFRFGFVLTGGHNRPSMDLLAIDRICVVREMTIDAFHARLSGTSAFYHRWPFRR